MFDLYKELLPELGGYLTHAGKLHRGRLEVFLHKLANLEAKVLQERALVSSEAALPGASEVEGEAHAGRSCSYVGGAPLHLSRP